MKSVTGRSSCWRFGMALVFLAAVLLLAACGGEGGVAGARAGFIAEVQSFTVVAPEVDEMVEGEAGEGEAADASEDAEEGEEGAGEGEESAELETVDILLDILVHNEGSGTLDGITVDLTIADPDGIEKEHRLLWIETAGLTKGSQSQEVYELKGVAYTEGDGFHAEVRQGIPMEERGDYREFDGEGASY